jgi:hypothetical protein
MNIPTNSSEGGGGDNHGAPDFSYIEAKLTKRNFDICKKYNFLLNKIYSKYGKDDYLFNGSALQYGKKTGFYIIGLNRKNLSDNEITAIFINLIKKLQIQSNNKRNIY